MFQALVDFFTIPQQEIAGAGYSLFGIKHLFFLFITLISSIFIGRWFAHIDQKSQRKYFKILAWIILGMEVFKDIIFYANGIFTINNLPFHLCGLNIFFIMYHAYKPSENIAEWLFAVCMPSTLLALLFPDWTNLPIFSYLSIHNFAIHITLFLYPSLLLASGFRPKKDRLKFCLCLFIDVMGILSVLNFIFDTNFMFMSIPAPGTPLVWLESLIGHWYVALMPLLALVVWLFEYTIYDILEKWKKSKS